MEMIDLYATDELSTEYHKDDIECRAAAINHCQERERKRCVSDYLQQPEDIQRGFQHVQTLREVLIRNLKRITSHSSANSIVDSVRKLDEVKIQVLAIEERECVIQQQLASLPNGNDEDLENEIKVLSADIEALIFELEEIKDNLSKTRLSPVSHEREEEEEGVIDSDTTVRMERKIRLANDFVSRFRGPFKIVIDAPMHIVELCTRGKHANRAVVKAVRDGLIRQRDQEKNNSSLKPAFTEITSNWELISKNTDRGFSSASEWMRNPQGQRILVKTQDHPLSAANEWLAYALGELMGLSVNEVQIAIYRNDLVTLHTDITGHNEKSITYMDLPKQRRKAILTSPAIACMDLFDHILQNVDRNPRNILITIPTTDRFDDATTQSKIYLIDHSASFGMGKLNIISVMASKFHSEHLSVVKFDPKDKGDKFEQYLNKLPMVDRVLIRHTLNRFAAIADDQFDRCINEVHDLLSVSQYNRIREVLYRQRDIAKRYAVQWDIYHPYADKTKQHAIEMDDMITYF